MRCFVVAVLMVAACSSQTAATTATVELRGSRTLALRVEIADDRNERARGLMGRTDVPDGTGMLFLYPSAGRWGGYWMKNTLVPLDIAFVRERRVTYVATMQPCRTADCPFTEPPEPYDSAIETRAGTFDAYGIAAGATVVR